MKDMSKITSFFLFTISLATAPLPTKTFFSVLQKEVGSGLKKVGQKLSQSIKQDIKK